VTNEEATAYAVLALQRAIRLGLVTHKLFDETKASSTYMLFADEVTGVLDEYTGVEAVERARRLWDRD
jgi:hypothetical protein